jgi:adenylosuccinate synthase
VTQLVVTKVDVLNRMETIRAANSYRLDGEELQHLPYDLCEGKLEPQYIDYPGWMEDLGEHTQFENLPEAARQYILALEQHLETPVTMISNGPERHKLILKPKS